MNQQSAPPNNKTPKTIKNISSIAFLIAANCLPLVGTIFLGWDIPTVLFVYWLESIFIGLFGALKLFMASGKSGIMIYGSIMFVVTYVIMLYVYFQVIQGIAMMLQGQEVTAINNPYNTSLLEKAAFLLVNFSGSIIISAISLLASHIYSFFTNFLRRKEYQTRQHDTFHDLMYFPYKRIVTMHVVLIFGSVLVAVFSTAQFFVVLLVGLKILADVLAHMVEHNMISRQRLASSSWLMLFGAKKH